jgi:hypothetical protein
MREKRGMMMHEKEKTKIKQIGFAFITKNDIFLQHISKYCQLKVYKMTPQEIYLCRIKDQETLIIKTHKYVITSILKTCVLQRHTNPIRWM